MKNRKEIIQELIYTRVSKNETQKCVFWISPSKYDDITVKKINDILDRNHVEHKIVDTVLHSWNLDREWTETEPMDCIVEYCGVYPIDWDIEDTVELERMEKSGEIMIKVSWIVDGEYIPNH